MKIFKDRKSSKSPMMQQKYHFSKHLCVSIIISNIIILTKLSLGRVCAWPNNIDHIANGHIGMG